MPWGRSSRGRFDHHVLAPPADRSDWPELPPSRHLFDEPDLLKTLRLQKADPAARTRPSSLAPPQ